MPCRSLFIEKRDVLPLSFPRCRDVGAVKQCPALASQGVRCGMLATQRHRDGASHFPARQAS